MKFYDAHIHFYSSFGDKGLKQAFDLLKAMGLAGFDALVFPEFPPEMEQLLQMIPKAYHAHATQQALQHHRDPFPLFRLAEDLEIIAFVDGRFIEHEIEHKIRQFRERGFEGLKLLYVPEEDLENGIGGMERAFGRSVKDSETITARLIDRASSEGMWILMHADLKRYGEFVREMVQSHPLTHFNIPHFGSSRKVISALVDTCPNCYTDLSSLIPAMERDPDAYQKFIIDYQDRILFGSDALIGWPEQVASALRFVNRLLEGGKVLEKLTNKNYLKFHHLSGRT
jgi:hypothetical protein